MPVIESGLAWSGLARPQESTASQGRQRRGLGLLIDLVALTRPLQWTKSLLVALIALATAPRWSAVGLTRVGWSALVLILASAVVYVTNDIADRDRDRGHPEKCRRPLASGRVDLVTAIVFAVLLAGVLCAAMAAGPSQPYWPVLAYVALNLAYSRGLKHLPLIDVGLIATGFVLRLVQVTLAIGAGVSTWLLLAVFSLCLVLVLGKRRTELLSAGAAHRPALRGYTVAYLDHLIQLCCGLTVVSGLLYLDNGAPLDHDAAGATMVSLPLVLFGLSRYLQDMIVEREGADPVRTLVNDRPLVIAAALWVGWLGVVLVLAHNPSLVNQLFP